MVKNHKHGPVAPGDAVTALELRSQASALLQRLVDGRNRSEQRSAELGQRDAIKYVTGRSALEDAIAATRSILREMDQLLEDMNSQVAEIDLPTTHLAIGSAMGSANGSATGSANGNGIHGATIVNGACSKRHDAAALGLAVAGVKA